MSGIGPLEVLIALILGLPVFYGLRLARRPSPRDAPLALVVAAWVLAALPFVLPLCFLVAVPLGGLLVGRGRRQGWAVMALAAAALIGRGVLIVAG